MNAEAWADTRELFAEQLEGQNNPVLSFSAQYARARAIDRPAE